MKTLPLQLREAQISADSVNLESRTFDLVWSTGAPVKRYDWWTDEIVSEELDLSGADLTRLNSGAPVLNSHSAWSLGSVIGVVERAWVDGNEGKATVRFSQRDDVDPILRDIQDGILRNVSVGYSVNKAERIRSAQKGAPDTVRVTDFTPMEISIVAVPADPGAQVRSQEELKFPFEVREMSGTENQPAEEVAAGAAAVSQNVGTSSESNADESIQAEATRAAEIAELCATHGMPEKAAELIRSRASTESVKDQILSELQKRSGPVIDNKHGAGAEQQRSASKINPQAIYAKRSQNGA